MYMDDVKVFAENEKELVILIQTIRIYSQDIGMEFDIEKYDMMCLSLGRGKREITEEIELNQEKSVSLEKWNIQVLRNIRREQH